MVDARIAADGTPWAGGSTGRFFEESLRGRRVSSVSQGGGSDPLTSILGEKSRISPRALHHEPGKEDDAERIRLEQSFPCRTIGQP